MPISEIMAQVKILAWVNLDMAQVKVRMALVRYPDGEI